MEVVLSGNKGNIPQHSSDCRSRSDAAAVLPSLSHFFVYLCVDVGKCRHAQIKKVYLDQEDT